jgi:hypothetical protein
MLRPAAARLLRLRHIAPALKNVKKHFLRSLAVGKAPISLPARLTAAPTRYLSMMAIFKNEAPYLAEWLEFHRLVGVEHAYLYDNGSTDAFHAVLGPFIREKFVTLLPWSFPRDMAGLTAQRLAFAHCIMNFGDDWRWMAFIDVDEFLYPVQDDNLAVLLSRYEDLPALAAFWTMFGFSGHEHAPDGLVIENYTKRARFPTHAKPKSIVDPAKVVGVSSAHLFDLTVGPRRAYTESRQVTRRHGNGAAESNIIRLNHYYTRSRHEFDVKIARYAKIGKGNIPRKIAALIEENPVYDETIFRFVPELKERLKRLHDH